MDLLHEILVMECSSVKDTGLAGRAAVYPLSSLAPVHTLYFDLFGICLLRCLGGKLSVFPVCLSSTEHSVALDVAGSWFCGFYWVVLLSSWKVLQWATELYALHKSLLQNGVSVLGYSTRTGWN